jgi:hypothetical protein
VSLLLAYGTPKNRFTKSRFTKSLATMMIGAPTASHEK